MGYSWMLLNSNTNALQFPGEDGHVLCHRQALSLTRSSSPLIRLSCLQPSSLWFTKSGACKTTRQRQHLSQMKACVLSLFGYT